MAQIQTNMKVANNLQPSKSSRPQFFLEKATLKNIHETESHPWWCATFSNLHVHRQQI